MSDTRRKISIPLAVYEKIRKYAKEEHMSVPKYLEALIEIRPRVKNIEKRIENLERKVN